MRNLSLALTERAQRGRDENALEVFEVGSVNFGEWDDRASWAAASLRMAGVAPGARVGIVLDETEWLDYVCVYIGAQRAGTTPVTANPKNVGGRLVSLMEQAGVDVIISTAKLDAFTGLVVPPSDLVGDGSLDSVDTRLPGEILLTSGSTGIAKAVVCTHADLAFDRAERTGHGFRRSNEVHLSFTATGTSAAQRKLKSMILRSGLEHLLLPTFDAVTLARAIERHRATRLSLIPTTAASLLRSDFPWQFDIESITHVLISSAVSSPTILQALNDRFPRAVVINSYGLTEGGNAGIWGPFRSEQPTVVGYPTPETEVRVRAESPETTSEGVVGELEIRVVGTDRRLYLDGTPVADEDGWIRTGDRGRILATGEVEIIGRCDDEINIGGFRLDRQVVEDVLLRCPDLLDAGVAIVRGLNRDWIGAAVVPTTPALADSSAWLRSLLGKELGDAARHVRVAFVESIPRTPSGKTSQGEVERVLRTGRTDARSELDASCELVLQASRQVLQSPELAADDDFFDAGLDSLLALELVSEIADRLALEDDLDFWYCFDYWTPRLLANHLERLKLTDATRDGDIYA